MNLESAEPKGACARRCESNSRARDGEGKGAAVVAGSRLGGLSFLGLFF